MNWTLIGLSLLILAGFIYVYEKLPDRYKNIFMVVGVVALLIAATLAGSSW